VIGPIRVIASARLPLPEESAMPQGCGGYRDGGYAELAKVLTQGTAPQEESTMPRRHPHGRMTPAQYEQMAPHLTEAQRAAARLLVDDPARQPVRASVPADDDDDGEFAHLWPPKTPAEADRRRELAEHIAASAAASYDDDDDGLFDALFGPNRRPQR
jgi:hypothetical protein